MFISTFQLKIKVTSIILKYEKKYHNSRSKSSLDFITYASLKRKDEGKLKELYKLIIIKL